MQNHSEIGHRAYIPQAGLVTCSICLRVQRESGWVSADEAIRELRTFELGEPLHLAPAVCDECRDDLAERRGHSFAKAA
jgi:hypothetical protein